MKRVLGILVSVATVCACGGGSVPAALARHLIPSTALEGVPWKLQIQKVKSTGRDYGVAGKLERGAIPAGSPPTTLILGRAEAVVTRQWTNGKGSESGPLPEGIVAINNTVARFRSASDAHAFAASVAPKQTVVQPIVDVPGASYFLGPFGQSVPGLEPEGNREVVIVERGDYVLATVLLGGGSRPTPADAAAIALLQAATAPPN